MILLHVFSNYVKVLAAAVLIACLRRTPARPYQIRCVAAGVAALLLHDVYVIFAAQLTPDYHIFWKVGRDLWEGLDPYDPVRFATDPFLNPPTALPVFALFATLPYQWSLIIWTLLNILLCSALPVLASRTLDSQETSYASRSEAPSAFGEILPSVLAALTLVLIVSDAFRYGLFAGQLGVVTALALLAALDRQGRGRPIAAGFWLGLATIKVSTMLPFLLLFLRKRDVWTWIALGLTCLMLCLLGGPPALLPGRISWTLQQIEALSSPGRVNDYSFLGTQYANMIGIDHALYRLGLRDRAMIRTLQSIGIVLLGLWIARQVLASRLPHAALCSLVALYSILFFYHRIYDTVVLVLPLVYSVNRARVAEGRPRWLFVASSISILLVLFASASFLRPLTESSLNWGLRGHFVQATVVLPSMRHGWSWSPWRVSISVRSIGSGRLRIDDGSTAGDLLPSPSKT